MTFPRTQIVATLTSRSIDALKQEIDRVRGSGVDYAEVRVDRLESREWARLSELFPTTIPLIATLRSEAEGGEGPDEPKERGPVLERIASLPFSLLDLEEQRDASSARSWGTSPSYEGRVILSKHLAGAPAGAIELPRLEGAARSVRWRKLAFAADLHTFVARVLPWIEAPHDPAGVILTSGPSGSVLRALAARLGLPAVYGAPGTADGVEPSQLPTAEMIRYFDAGGDGPLFGLLGLPVDRSASPRIQNLWMSRRSLPGLYVAIEIGSIQELGIALEKLPALGFRGFNVTAPWKQAALVAADSRTERAEAAGCANILRVANSGLVADNSDAAAVERRLVELAKEPTRGPGRVAVLGSGGAASAAAAAVSRLEWGCSIFARNSESARKICRSHGCDPGQPDAKGYPWVINATPVGNPGVGSMEIPLGGVVGPGSYVVDFVYHPKNSEVRDRARAAGAGYEDGWRLLVYQAADTYEHWWDRPLPSDLISEALELGA